MKIGRLNIGFNKRISDSDAIVAPTVKLPVANVEDTTPIKLRDPSYLDVLDAVTTISPMVVANPRILAYGKYSTSRKYGALEWNDPEFDLKDIAYCLATEALFRRTVDKYVELIWRNGYKLIGDNKDAIQYIKDRFEQIATVTDTPIDIFLRSVSQQLVTYSNSFIEKVRNQKASGGRSRKTFDGKKLEPIAGYFVADATSIKIAQDIHGRAIKYQQYIETSIVDVPPEWQPDDFIHIYKDREAGLLFGTPMAAPVINDMKALRLIEENVEILVFNNAIPLTIYLVGDVDNKPTDTEIRRVREKVRGMSTEGMLVIPYHHKVETIGSEGRALRCEGYLEYFKNRVLAGLGTSEVALGYSGGAGRQAAETIEKGMYNTTREMQNVIKLNIEEHIIKELLAEGGFDWDQKNRVNFFFPEIDIDDRIKLENHVINAFSGNMYDEDEMREAVGREPYTEEQRAKTHFELIEKPRTLMLAADEAYLLAFGNSKEKAAAQTLIAGRQTAAASTKPQPQQKLTGGQRAAKSLDQPQNQHGKKLNPGTKKDSFNSIEDSVITNTNISDSISKFSIDMLENLNYIAYKEQMLIEYNNIKSNILSIMNGMTDNTNSNGVTINESITKGIVNVFSDITYDSMMNKAQVFIIDSYNKGVSEGFRQLNHTVGTYDFTNIYDYLKRKNEYWVKRVINAVAITSNNIILSSSKVNDAISDVSNVFESNEYRISMGTRNELQRAYNIGVISAGLIMKAKSFTLINTPYDEDGACSEHANIEYILNSDIDLNAIPPGYMTHMMCTCIVKLNL